MSVGPGGRWVAPAVGLGLALLAIACELWRAAPLPIVLLPTPTPPLVEPPPLVVDGPIRDPFGPSLPGPATAVVGSGSQPAARPGAEIPPPVFSGIFLRDGLRYLVAPEGLVPERGRIGPWSVVEIRDDQVIVEARGRRIRLDATGQLLEDEPPERR